MKDKNPLNVILLFLLILIFFSPLLTGKFSYFFHDLKAFYLPAKYILRASLLKGVIPLWTDLIQGGFPLHAEGQTALFYPPNLILYRFFHLNTAFVISIIFHFFWAGLGLFLLVRKINGNTIGAFIAAFTFTFSGFMVTHLFHLSILTSAAWLPMIFFCSYSLLKSRKLIWFYLLALSLALQILAGHPQIIFITWSSLLFLVIVINLLKFRELKVWKSSIFIILAIIFSICLSAVQLLPSLQMIPETIRGQDLPLSFFMSGSFPPQNLITLFSPNFFGINSLTSQELYKLITNQNAPLPWIIGGLSMRESHIYMGLLPLILLFFPLFSGKRYGKKISIEFIFLAFFALFVMLGKYSPIAPLLKIIFPLTHFRFPARFCLVLTFSVSILAGVSWENLEKTPPKEILRAVKRIAAIIFLLIITFFSLHSFLDYNKTIWNKKIERIINKKGRSNLIKIKREHKFMLFEKENSTKNPNLFNIHNDISTMLKKEQIKDLPSNQKSSNIKVKESKVGKKQRKVTNLIKPSSTRVNKINYGVLCSTNIMKPILFVPFFFMVLISIIIALFGAGLISDRILRIGLIVIMCIDVFSFALPYNPYSSNKQISAKPQTAAFLKNKLGFFQRIAVLDKTRPDFSSEMASLYGDGLYKSMLHPAYNAMWKIPALGNPSPLIFDRWKKTLDKIGLIFAPMNHKERNRRFLAHLNLFNIAGVSYLLTTEPIHADNWYEAFKWQGAIIYKNDKLSSTSFKYYNSATFIDKPSEAFEAIMSPKFNPDKFIYIENDKKAINQTDKTDNINHRKRNFKSITSIKIRQKLNNKINLTIESVENGWLLIPQTYYVGWHATCNNVPLRIFRADYLFSAVYLKKGHNDLRLSFKPISVTIGLFISLLTLALLIVFFIISKTKLNNDFFAKK